MVLIDTTVWISFFAGKDEPSVHYLVELITKEQDICICGIVLTEILQGIRIDSQYLKTASYLNNLLYLPMNSRTFIRSASSV
ncbi:hypothetical protein BVY01_04000 [bacterium I07]|nr:hypothetical protein BVY01_04000 [bacterium I07]